MAKADQDHVQVKILWLHTSWSMMGTLKFILIYQNRTS
jgi:hypothetical protein